MRNFIITAGFIFCSTQLIAQELYPYTEPASNMPSKSISVKASSMFGRDLHTGRIMQRHMPEVMFGLNKKWMLHAGINFSDMYNENLIWEGARVYGKYRFLSLDEVHKHFRMAGFAAATYSRKPLPYNELNMMGDQSGVQVGLIATQLWNKLAISGTGGYMEILDNDKRKTLHNDFYAQRSLNYSLSAGYLLFPLEYTNYDQTNVNLYAELLGGRNLGFDAERYYVDLAPSIQFIFKSTGKLNLGYRFELSSDISRLSRRQFMVSYEHIFLNALDRKKKTN
ncbi:MAG TPA: hypothetical protein VD794_11115 [Flavisolibacter sp.]|nr:hypothetical protein [Flavisolibacter sp.]